MFKAPTIVVFCLFLSVFLPTEEQTTLINRSWLIMHELVLIRWTKHHHFCCERVWLLDEFGKTCVGVTTGWFSTCVLYYPHRCTAAAAAGSWFSRRQVQQWASSPTICSGLHGALLFWCSRLKPKTTTKTTASTTPPAAATTTTMLLGYLLEMGFSGQGSFYCGPSGFNALYWLHEIHQCLEASGLLFLSFLLWCCSRHLMPFRFLLIAARAVSGRF